MHGHLNVKQYITMHGHLNVKQYITMHGYLNVKLLSGLHTYLFITKCLFSKVTMSAMVTNVTRSNTRLGTITERMRWTFPNS